MNVLLLKVLGRICSNVGSEMVEIHWLRSYGGAGMPNKRTTVQSMYDILHCRSWWYSSSEESCVAGSQRERCETHRLISID